ncbi:MAG: AAA family ATPase [Rhodospirillaceae bacterium]
MSSAPKTAIDAGAPDSAPGEARPAAKTSRHDNFVQELKDLIKARFPIIQIATYEEERVLNEIEKIAQDLDHKLLIWSASRGVYNLPGQEDKHPEKPNKFADADLAVALEFLEAAAEKQKSPLLMVLLDPEPYLIEKNANPIFRRKLRDIAVNIRSKGYMANCLIVSPSVNIPVELEKDVTVLDFPLPDRDEIRALIKRVISRFKDTKVIKVGKNGGLVDALVDAASGLTLHEIESCLARSIVDDQTLDISDVSKIIRQKQLIIRKNGLLEFYDTANLGVDQIGGLGALKNWLKTREAAFSEKGREYGISTPKGVLLTGVPGCGKSLSAKCVAAAWRLPLIRLDLGRIYSKWVGSSEENVRAAIATTEAVAPCVLWIDEIEKGIPRTEGHVGDNGVSLRVFASFLTWLQEKTAPVFVFATANQLDLLAPEILRKGRFDEVFFVDLPTDDERREIIEIHLTKVGRKPGDFDMDELVRLSGEETFGEGVRLSGAEIESWVNESLIRSFYRARTEDSDKPQLTMDDFRTVVRSTTPLAKMRASEIQTMRTWANSHALSASAAKPGNGGKENEARLPGGRRVTIFG